MEGRRSLNQKMIKDIKLKIKEKINQFKIKIKLTKRNPHVHKNPMYLINMSPLQIPKLRRQSTYNM